MGANLFVGNLDTDVDEKMLYDTFSSFGLILSTKVNTCIYRRVVYRLYLQKIMRDPDTGASKAYGFVSYDNFESSDAALNAMNGTYHIEEILPLEQANSLQIKQFMSHTLIRKIQRVKDTEAQLVRLLHVLFLILIYKRTSAGRKSPNNCKKHRNNFL